MITSTFSKLLVGAALCLALSPDFLMAMEEDAVPSSNKPFLPPGPEAAPLAQLQRKVPPSPAAAILHAAQLRDSGPEYGFGLPHSSHIRETIAVMCEKHIKKLKETLPYLGAEQKQNEAELASSFDFSTRNGLNSYTREAYDKDLQDLSFRFGTLLPVQGRTLIADIKKIQRSFRPLPPVPVWPSAAAVAVGGDTHGRKRKD